ncbi:ABC transporter permease [Niallia sp. 01092]|uniref:ABC transporter permease n=1 Tax=unclassified Niallia TaxID=2837522 RepID=UPI003FCFEF27
MFLKIYIKEIKDCFRDRRTLLLTVFLPIIMMTGLTLFYEKLVSNGEGETFTLAVDSSLDKGVENVLKTSENLQLKHVANPEKTLQKGEAQAALIFDRHFSANIQNGTETNITIIGDTFSQSSSTLISLVTNALSQYEKSIVFERLEKEGVATNIIQPFQITQKEISAEDPTINVIAMLIPLILAISIGVGSGPSAADLFAGEKEKKTMEALLMTPINRSILVFAKWLTITTIGTITGVVTLIVVVLEITFLTENLKKAIHFDNNYLATIGFSLLITIIYSMFVASLHMLTSIIGKTIKEAQSYSTPIMMLTVFPLMFTSNLGINELKVKHFAIPIMNLFSLLKELIFGILNYEHIFITFGSNIIVMVIVFLLGRLLFLKDKWVMN